MADRRFAVITLGEGTAPGATDDVSVVLAHALRFLWLGEHQALEKGSQLLEVPFNRLANAIFLLLRGAQGENIVSRNARAARDVAVCAASGECRVCCPVHFA